MPACLVFITISPALINEARTAQLHYGKYTQELNQSTADSNLWLEARIKQDFFFCREINQIKSKREILSRAGRSNNLTTQVAQSPQITQKPPVYKTKPCQQFGKGRRCLFCNSTVLSGLDSVENILPKGEDVIALRNKRARYD